MQDVRFFCLRGFMKSGTNWLGALLSSHRDISCIGEFHWEEFTSRIVPRDLAPACPRDEYGAKAKRHLEELIRKCMLDAAEPGAKLIGDRTPTTLEPLPLTDIPYISIIRDGRDVLVSRAFHLYNNAHVHRLFHRIPEMKPSLAEFEKDPWYFHNNPEKLLCHEVMVRESVRWWNEHLESDAATVEKHPDLKVRFVRYEDLHTNTKKIRNELFEFLDVDPKRAAPVKGHLKPGFKKERPSEFLRKGAVGDWKNYFTEQTKEWFKLEAGESLIKHGYEQNNDW